jgi:hypothetical protein
MLVSNPVYSSDNSVITNSQTEHVQPCELALDTPSVTLLAFMNKYYQLDNPIWQNTNFVVFPKFFEFVKEKGRRYAWNDFNERVADGKTEKAIDGWIRPNTPRHLGVDAPTENRYLKQTGRDTASLVSVEGGNRLESDNLLQENKAHSAAWGADLSTDGTMATRTQAAKANKAFILSSKPLW